MTKTDGRTAVLRMTGWTVGWLSEQMARL